VRLRTTRVSALIFAIGASQFVTWQSQAHDDVVSASDYKSFAAAVAAIGSKATTLVVNSIEIVSEPISIPATLHIQILGGGQFTKSATGSIRFNGTLDAPLRHIFSKFDKGGIEFGHGAVREVYPQWWGAMGDGISDDTWALQAAIDSCNRVVVPPGLYRTTSTLLVSDRMGFTFTGAGMKTTSLVAGTPGMVLFRVRNCIYSSFRDFFLNGDRIAANTLVIDQHRGGEYVTNTDTFDRIWFGYATDSAVVVGDENNGQTDNLTFNECIFSNSPSLVQVRGIVTLGIRFNGGSLNYPSIVGFDLIEGGEVSISRMHFLGGFDQGTYPSIAMVRRAITFGHVVMTENEMEGYGPFLVGPEDSGFANTWPVELIGNTIGYTGPAGSIVIDYRQRGPLIIIGGDINGTEPSIVNYDPPGSAMLYDVGVRYHNIKLVMGAAGNRSGRKATGELMAGFPHGNIIGNGSAVSGTDLTLGMGAADDSIYRTLAHRGGGGSANATQVQYTTTGITATAKTITSLEQNAALVIVAGTDGANSFVDLVLTGNSLPPTVVAGNTTTGNPASRTYSVSGFALKLAMAADTYRTNTHSLQLTAR
jgi:hypothetical protein